MDKDNQTKRLFRCDSQHRMPITSIFWIRKKTSKAINQENKSGCWHNGLQATLSICLPVCFTCYKFHSTDCWSVLPKYMEESKNYCLFPTILFSSKIKRNDTREAYDVTFKYNRGNEEDLVLLSQQ